MDVRPTPILLTKTGLMDALAHAHPSHEDGPHAGTAITSFPGAQSPVR